MAEQTDRWVSRILDLPVFDVEFARSVKKTPLNSLAFVTALEATSGTQFAQKVFDLAGSFEESGSKVFQGRELMLEQFWTLSISVEKAYFESTAVQLGFGLCEKSSSTPSVDPSASLKKRAAIANLTAKPFAQPKRSKATVESSSSSSTPLLDKEKSEKKRTMAGHIKTFERLERWFGALDAHQFQALQASVMSDRAKTLKEGGGVCGVTGQPRSGLFGVAWQTKVERKKANWKNPEPLVLKYTRNRSSVPALMVKQLVKDLVQESHPGQEDSETLLMDAPDSNLHGVEYFIKKPSAGSSYEYKFHCTSRDNEEFTACNKFALLDCSSAGDLLPDESVLCKACAKARPEVASFHQVEPPDKHEVLDPELKDVARARKRASERYRVAVEEFVAAATAEGPHLLLLDKNHPPSGIRQEVEALQVTCQSFGCRLLPKVLAIEGADAPAMSEVEVELLGAEERHFGDWNYPWSLDVLAECAARLLKRPQHETLTGSETPLFVLLSFLQLHQRFNSANLKFPVLQVPYVSTCANLASFAGSTEEWMWCRLEVRALLRQTLDLMRKPFENQQQLRPLLQSLVTQLRAPGLRSVDPGVQRQHQERCLDALWPELLVEEEQSMTTPGFSAPALRYVALDVHAHHPLLESLLEKTSAALHAVADLRSDGDELSELFASFRRPAAQHVTTCYLGGAAEAAQWRKVVAESKALVLEGKAFDLRITHLVGAPGALAFAVVDRGQLVSDGLPMAEQQRPHITLCTRAPWQPRHSNELLEAVTPWLDDRTVQAAGKWVRNLKVNSAVLDVFILQLEHPVVLPSNPLRLC
ncbi:Uncharacterized protein SCF082_LOCUS22074 [Durusdinium trenchii]|uniref:Uncharacterized protein n=1 Tax=Durusdinium trenchii TaxID=1381693 RepID=A0ABP0LF79_9DINO